MPHPATCKQKSFDGKLANEPGAGSSERAAKRHLASTTLRPDQQKAGDIHEANQRKQASSAEERDEGWPDVSEDGIRQRHHRRAAIAVRFGILDCDSTGNGCKIRVGRRSGNALLQPRHSIVWVACAIVCADAIESDPELRGSHRRKMKSAGQHTDDYVWSAIKCDRRAKHISVRSKALLPCLITQDHGLLCARLILSGAEITAKERGHTKCSKETVAHPGA